MLVKERMIHNPVTVRPETTVIDAQALMRREKISRLPVLNKAGKLAGIVSKKTPLCLSQKLLPLMYEMHFMLAKLTIETVMQKKVITVEIPL